MSIWVVVKGQIVLVYQSIISIIWVMEKGINFKRKKRMKWFYLRMGYNLFKCDQAFRTCKCNDIHLLK